MREFAKFLCGFETYHALFHAYLFITGAPFSHFGIVSTPMISLGAACMNLAFAIGLGAYAWRGTVREA